MALSKGQYIATVLTTLVSALLSMAGSLVIMKHTRKNVRKSVGQRVLFVMSLTDLISSANFMAAHFLSNTDAPVDTDLWSVGNRMSCRIVGALGIILSSWIALTNAMLSLYYLTTVRYGWRDEDFTKRAEIYGYVFALTFPTTIAAIALWMNSINPQQLTNLCNTYSSPLNCTGNPELDCVQMYEYAPYYIGSMDVFATMVLSVLSIVSTRLLARSVRRQLNRMRGRQLGGSSPTVAESTKSSASPSRSIHWVRSLSSRSLRLLFRNKETTTSLQGSLLARKKLVSTQATLYCLAYVNIFCWKVMLVLFYMLIPYPFEASGKGYMFWFQIGFWLLTPLQGFFNCLIFIRPKLLECQRENPQACWWDILHSVLTQTKLEDPTLTQNEPPLITVEEEEEEETATEDEGRFPVPANDPNSVPSQGEAKPALVSGDITESSETS